MASWVNISLGQYLTVDIMNAIYNNFVYLSEKMAADGIQVPDLENNTVSYEISPADILAKFNAVEHNIDILHTLVEYSDEYYETAFVWTEDMYLPEYLRNGVSRWINWLNCAKENL